MNREQAQNLLAQLLLDELDPLTAQQLTDYLKTDEQLREQLADMRLTAQLLRQGHQAQPQTSLSDKANRKLLLLANRAQQSSTHPAPRRQSHRPPFQIATLWRIAASILIMIGLGGMALVLWPATRTAAVRSKSDIAMNGPTDASATSRSSGHEITIDKEASDGRKRLEDGRASTLGDQDGWLTESDEHSNKDNSDATVQYFYEQSGGFASGGGGEGRSAESDRRGRKEHGASLSDSVSSTRIGGQSSSEKLALPAEPSFDDATFVTGSGKPQSELQATKSETATPAPADESANHEDMRVDYGVASGPVPGGQSSEAQPDAAAAAPTLPPPPSPPTALPVPVVATAPAATPVPAEEAEGLTVVGGMAAPVDPQAPGSGLKDTGSLEKQIEVSAPLGEGTSGEREGRIALAGESQLNGSESTGRRLEPVTDVDYSLRKQIDGKQEAKDRLDSVEGMDQFRYDKVEREQKELAAGVSNMITNEAVDLESLPAASSFRTFPVSPWILTERDRLSTFALDTDTASYALARRFIESGYLPPAGAVRMEEFVNAFDYNYSTTGSQTFTIHAEAAPAPFARPGSDTVLLKIGVKGKVIGRDGRKPAHLVIVVDASGSMAQPLRLPLVKYALHQLAAGLREGDRISLIAYSTEARLHLEAADAAQREPIIKAIDAIEPGGSTNLLDGLEQAYQIAERYFKAGQINRVILCSDGVANVGQTDSAAILSRVDRYRRQGIALTTAGFGISGLNDALLEELANKGDGNYLFIDSQVEARRAFAEQMTATLQLIARDAKIQVDFDPARVRRYRLIGYENRDIADRDFRNDAVDAGEVGSGQSATALYELELHGEQRAIDQPPLGTVYVRYRDVDTDRVEEISRRLPNAIVRSMSVEESPRFYLAACAAAFAEVLRQSPNVADLEYEQLERCVDQVAAALPLDRQVAQLRDLIHAAADKPAAP